MPSNPVRPRHPGGLACAWLLLPCALLACGDPDSEAQARRDWMEASAELARAPGCERIDLETPEDGTQLALPITVPAHDEREYCRLVLLDRDINLNWSEGYYTHGSHHGSIHATGYHGELPRETVDGEPFNGDPGAPHPCPNGPSGLWDARGTIAGARSVRRQSSRADGRRGVLPDHVATRLKAGDVVLVDFHMINAGDEPLDSCVKINMHGIPGDQVEEEAGNFFLYNLHIAVPAADRASARMACPILEDVTLLSAVSHMHQLGVFASARLWDGMPAAPDSEPIRELYEQTRWAEPPVVVFDEPLTLKEGQWIEWYCEFENDSERPVSQGTASTDEMCMFIGAYFPKNLAMQRCENPEIGRPQLNGINLTDGPLDGADFLDCMDAAPRVFSGNGTDPERYETLWCFTQTCASVSPLTQPYLQCLASDPTGCQDLRAEIEATVCD